MPNEQIEMIELLPCPFCGGAPVAGFMGDEDGGYGFVECRKSCAQAHEDTTAEAIAAWNTRPPPDTGQGMREALVEAVSRAVGNVLGVLCDREMIRPSPPHGNAALGEQIFDAIDEALSQASLSLQPDDGVQEAAQGLLDRMFSTLRNGKGVEADDGEMCWIVHSDDIETLRAALAQNTGASSNE